jgi:hypothetical protein
LAPLFAAVLASMIAGRQRSLSEEPVIHARGEQFVTLEEGSSVTWQEFHTLRNLVLDALRPFGTVGPLGHATITDAEDGPSSPWVIETEDPDFFVVDDMWNTWQRSIHVETERPWLIRLDAIKRIRDVLQKQPKPWTVSLATEAGYILVGVDNVIVSGPVYRRCKTVGDVVRTASLRAV